MNISHYIGLDVHKKHINFCIKTADGTVVEEGRLAAQRVTLRAWAAGQTQAWHGAMEATLFSGWIYDTLDARKIADLVRCHLLPACYVATPQIRELRRLLRYRNLVVRESVRMQNKIAGLLMESGAPFHKQKLHGKKYFAQLLDTLEEVPDSVKDLLNLSRSAMEMFQATQKRLLGELLAHPQLRQRVERLASIRGVGPVTALTWALEVGDPFRFSCSAQAMSYCGLTSAL